MPRNPKVLKTAGGFFSEFRNFALKGNAIELAIAVIIGGAFSRIISSLVADIITPLIAFFSGGADFKNLSLVLREATEGEPGVILSYGTLLQHAFDFFFIALSIFIVFKLLSSARERLFRREEAGAVPPQEKPAQERLLEDIRDLLKERK